MVPKKGLEPLRSRERQILSLVRLPFRHFGFIPHKLLHFQEKSSLVPFFLRKYS